MFQRLQFVAHAFAATANDHEIVAVLDAIAADADLFVYGLAPLHRMERDIDEALKSIFGPSVNRTQREDMMRLRLAHTGPSLIRDYVRISPSFTLTESEQRLQPRGEDRWLWNAYRDTGVPDALVATHGSCSVSFGAQHVLGGGPRWREIEAVLGAATAMAGLALRELEAPQELPALAGELSPRERSILLWLSEGKKVPYIAEHTQTSEASVKTHIKRACRKLGADGQLHAVAIALRRHLIA